ncbi:hypothetical protein [Streptomyces sp. NPDC093990]|uniref:hypothetical protein n=1 Tax=Streptomyces sp. NPDC093990 TaxID=3155306 RepID=UPI003414179E
MNFADADQWSALAFGIGGDLVLDHASGSYTLASSCAMRARSATSAGPAHRP